MDPSSVNIKEEIQQLMTNEEKQIVEERRKKYLKKDGKKYTWDEVKAFAKSSKGK